MKLQARNWAAIPAREHGLNHRDRTAHTTLLRTLGLFEVVLVAGPGAEPCAASRSLVRLVVEAASDDTNIRAAEAMLGAGTVTAGRMQRTQRPFVFGHGSGPVGVPIVILTGWWSEPGRTPRPIGTPTH
jgi:hypothetical protein